VPALQAPRHSSGPETYQSISLGTRSSQRFRRLVSWIQSIFKALSFYFRHPVFLPSIALSLLYFTVLSFAGQMVTYLLSVGYNSTYIGLIRAISVVFEISATWIAPRAMTKLGPVRAGAWFVNWQILCIAVAVGLFWGAHSPLVAASGLVGGVIASRIGLWGFDLCIQIIIQEVSTTPIT
jgi:solute carrier family 40 (iron-regulated transporter), member 1